MTAPASTSHVSPFVAYSFSVSSDQVPLCLLDGHESCSVSREFSLGSTFTGGCNYTVICGLLEGNVCGNFGIRLLRVMLFKCFVKDDYDSFLKA